MRIAMPSSIELTATELRPVSRLRPAPLSTPGQAGFAHLGTPVFGDAPGHPSRAAPV